MPEEKNDEVVQPKPASKGKEKFLNADEYSVEELEALSRLYSQSFKDVKER